MFLPQWENLACEQIEIEDESEKDVDFDLVLTEDNLLELTKRKLIHPEADKIREDCKESAIIFTISGWGESGEDEVIGDLEECAVPLAAIENLFHENPLGVLTLELGEELLGMGVGGHFVFIEGVDEEDAFFDQLWIFHDGLLL